MPTPTSEGRRGERDRQRTTRWAMVVVGLVIWLVATSMGRSWTTTARGSSSEDGRARRVGTFGLLSEP